MQKVDFLGCNKKCGLYNRVATLFCLQDYAYLVSIRRYES